MAYTPCYPDRINWQNDPSEATALNDVNLNKMDSAIHTIDGRVVDMSTRLDTDDTAITNLQGNVSDLQGDMTTAQGNITALQSGKVDKVNGKGLSQVDNVTVTQHVAYGTVVSTIKTYKQDGTEVTSQVCNGIVVDSALSDSSTSPVQNKVVKSAIDEKSTVAISDTLATGTTLANITIDGTTTAIKGSDIAVDEELSPTSTNPVENKAIYDALNNLLPSKTVSGNPISISDASGFNAKALTVSMNPIQDLHGYDHPWAGGAGKNKLPFNIAEIINNNQGGTWSGNIYTYRGITFTPDSEGRWKATGTATEATFIRVGKFKPLSGSYLINGITGGSGTTYRIRYRVGDGSSQNMYDGDSNIITVDGDTEILFDLYVSVNYTADVLFSPMIRLASETDATFAPYSNICPISGRTEASVTRTGKNVFNLEKYLTDNNITYTKDGEWFIFSIGSVLYVNKFTLPELGYYSGQLIIDSTRTVATNVNLQTYKNGSAVTQGQTFTNQQIDQVGFNYSTTGQVCCKVQTEYGASNTTYEPYTAETHTKEFGQTVYGGEDDFVNGGATVNYDKITFDGTESWVYSVNRYQLRLEGRMKPGSYYNDDNVLCSAYPKSDTLGVNNTVVVGYNSGYLYFYVTEDFPTLNDWKTRLQQGDIELTYLKATPTTIQTSAENISLLKGNNVVSTDGDDMELKYSVSLDSLLPTTTRTLTKSPIVEEPKEETDETEEQR